MDDEKNYKRALWITIGFSLCLALWVQLPRLFDPTVIEEDMRTLFWLQSYQEPNDFAFTQLPPEERGLTLYQFGGLEIAIEDGSPGYSLLMFLGAQVMDPILFSKLLVFPLTAVAAYFAFLVGAHLRSTGTGVALGVVFTTFALASTTGISLDSGLHRSFALPGLLALLWYLMSRQYRRAALALILMGIFYLPIFPVAATTYFFSLFRQQGNGRLWPSVDWSGLLPLLVAVLIVTVAIAPVIVDRLTAVASSGTASSLPILQNPQYSSDGRQPLFGLFPITGRAGIVKEGIDFFNLTFLAGSALGIWLITRKATPPMPVAFRNLFIACWVWFGLAWVSIVTLSSFLFYLPNRHTRFGLFLLVLTYVVLNGKTAVTILAKWIQKQTDRLVWYAGGVTAILLVAALLLPLGEEPGNFMRSRGAQLLLISSGAVLMLLSIIVAKRKRAVNVPDRSKPQAVSSPTSVFSLALFLILAVPYLSLTNCGKFHQITQEQVDLHTYLESLPEESLLAGDPCALNSVQLFTGRDVIYTCERFEIQERLSNGTVLDNLRAYYADEIHIISTFCQNYNIDYLVADTTRFSEEWLSAEDLFYEPYNSQISHEIAARRHFVLNEIPKADRLFSAGNYFVVSCQYFTGTGTDK